MGQVGWFVEGLSRGDAVGLHGHASCPARAEAVSAPGQQRKPTAVFLPSIAKQVVHSCRFIAAMKFPA